MAACARGLAIILLPALPEISHSKIFKVPTYRVQAQQNNAELLLLLVFPKYAGLVLFTNFFEFSYCRIFVVI